MRNCRYCQTPYDPAEEREECCDGMIIYNLQSLIKELKTDNKKWEEIADAKHNVNLELEARVLELEDKVALDDLETIRVNLIEMNLIRLQDENVKLLNLLVEAETLLQEYTATYGEFDKE